MHQSLLQTLIFRSLTLKSLSKPFYPSLVLGLANLVAQQDESFDLIGYSLTNPREKSELLIKLNASALTEETTFRQTLEGKGKEFTFSPAINWDYSEAAGPDAAGQRQFVL